MKKDVRIMGLYIVLMVECMLLLGCLVYYVPEGQTAVYLANTPFQQVVKTVSGPGLVLAYDAFMPVDLIEGPLDQNLTSRIELDRLVNFGPIGTYRRHYSGEATYRIRPDNTPELYGLYDLYRQSKDLKAVSDRLVSTLFEKRLNDLLDQGVNCSKGDIGVCEKAYLEKGEYEFLKPSLANYGIHLQNLSVYSFPA